MKLLHGLLLAPVLILAAAAPRAAALPLPASSPAPAALRQGGPGEFAAKFRQAMKLGARAEMEALVRRYHIDSVDHVLGLCIQIAKESNDELEEEMAALRVAWKDAYASDFVENVYVYFSSLQLKPAIHVEWSKLKHAYDTVNRKYSRFINEKRYGAKEFLALGEELRGLAAGYETIGDDYMAGTCWLQSWQAFDELLAQEHADFAKALEGLQKGIPLYEKVGLKDALYTNAKLRLPALAGGAPTGGGGGDEAGGGEGAPAGAPAGGLASGKIPGVKLGPPVAVEMKYELIADLGDFSRPIYNGDEIAQSWNALALGRVDSSARFPNMKEFPADILRTGSSKAAVDVNADGTPDVEIPMGGRLTPVEVELGTGSDLRKWAFLAITLTETESYQGVEVNMAPSDSQMNIYFAPAASMVGTVGGTRVQVIDENMDGLYGSPPALWHYIGLTKDSNHPEFDSILVGGEKAARPWSEYQQIGSTWYRLEAERGGLRLQVEQAELPLGTLRLDYKGGNLDHLVVRGVGERLQNCYFDLVAGGKKGIQVPAGKYELFMGMISKGKRQQMAKAVVLPGKGMAPWAVEPDGTTTATLGAPFGFDFDVELDREWVTVNGASVCVVGQAGERYERPWNCVPRPEVSVRKAGSKKAGKAEKMPILTDQETLSTQGLGAAWFPFDLTVEGKDGEAVEVQLTEKKNKLFGNITSEWK